LQPHGSVYTLPPNKTIELSILGGQLEHAFSVVKSAGSDTYNYHNSVQQATISM
ncbi:hypothetical protein CY34DRAFT_94021, partial [Suillus luteus UH-Slu-Lm8-n1]